MYIYRQKIKVPYTSTINKKSCFCLLLMDVYGPLDALEFKASAQHSAH